jgi:3-oxoacyl-[acyl-carrier-protein] synthase II
MIAQRRVVVTGIGAMTPFGRSDGMNGFMQAAQAVRANRSVVRSYPEWSEYKGLRTRLGADIGTLPDRLSLKQSRSMGRVAQLAYYATEEALIDAAIESDNPLLTNGRSGISYGSGIGSTCALKDYARFISECSTQGLSATTYHRVMSHTCAANIGIVLKMTGRVIPTSSACTSGSQAIGYGYETIQAGLQDLMICGGAEEFAPAVAAIFDVLGACSVLNDTPESTPRPFDSQRDGIVIAESACTLILEELEHAKKRGAKILAEIVGFATNSDGYHITNPRQETMARCIRLALDSAQT